MEKKSLQEILAMGEKKREEKIACSIPGYTPERKKPADREHQLQVRCIRLFETLYPQYSNVLIAIPNGGRRDKVTGAKLKAEGVKAGASDLLLLHSTGQYGYLSIEMKDDHGRQSESQKNFEAAVNCNGGKYVICRSENDFLREVLEYLTAR